MRADRGGKRARRRENPVIPALLAVILALLTVAVCLAWPRSRQTEPEPESPPPAETVSLQEPEPPPPEPDPAELLLAEMTLREKVCQLFVVFPSDIAGESPVTAAGESTQKGLETYPVGGILYEGSNLVSREQAIALLAGTQSYSKIPLLFVCDEEGGWVSRVLRTVGTAHIDPMLRYQDQGVETAAANAKTIAEELRSLGFNMDLAPVADVWSNPANKVIGSRAYSTDFQQAAELVAAAVQGFHDGGTACTLKHFPGHGDTSADSHYGSAYVYKTLDELRAEELLPFRSGIAAGADAVMMGHLIVQEVDDQPALMSYRLVTDLLRQELGFDGVVITDSLQMQAMTKHYRSSEIAVNAVKAGVDLLLCPRNLDGAVEALCEAVESGEITQERLDESVLRILHLKLNLGLLESAPEE